MMIGRRIRHIKRYREIVTVLVKYGFGYIVRDVGLFHLLSLPQQIVSDFSDNSADGSSAGRRMRQMFEELGPTFIKLGQLLSLRADIVPAPIADELRKLQDRVTPIDLQTIKSIINQEFDMPAEDLFADFSDSCLAAASIAQVHRAVLRTGEEVVVKIRRPNIETAVENDIDILRDLAGLFEKRYTWARNFQIGDIVEEFSQAIRSEMDYFREGRNTDKLYQYFSSDENIIIPKVYWDYSTSKILTLEYIHGIRFEQIFISDDDGLDRKIISERLVRSFLDQALNIGTYHGDPHPGNLLFFSGNRIAYIDFGQVGILNEDMKHNFASLIIGLMRGNTSLLYHTIFQMSPMPVDLNERQFKADLEQLRDKYYNLPFRDIHIGEVIHDIFETTKKHHIRIPKNYALLGKSLITLEGLITKLDNQISILELAEPYGQKLMLHRLNPEYLSKKLTDLLYEASENSIQLPSLLKKALTRFNSGKSQVDIKLSQLEFILSRLDRSANRISVSIILLSFSIILAGLIVGTAFGSHPLFSHTPIFGIAVAITVIMFFSLLLAIFRSGRL